MGRMAPVEILQLLPAAAPVPSHGIPDRVRTLWKKKPPVYDHLESYTAPWHDDRHRTGAMSCRSASSDGGIADRSFRPLQLLWAPWADRRRCSQAQDGHDDGDVMAA